MHSQLRSKLRYSYIFITLGSYRIKVLLQSLLELFLIFDIFSPSLTENNTNLSKVKSGYDYVKSQKRIATQFVPFDKCYKMLLKFSALYGQFQKVVTSFDVGGLVHEEHKEISTEVYKFISGDLDFELVIAGSIIYLYNLFLRFIFIPGKSVCLSFAQTNTSHFVDIMIQIINILP